MSEKRERIFELLSERAKILKKKWFEQIINTYPKDTAVFLVKEKDRFMNPVGYTLSTELDILLKELTGSMDESVINPSLNNIIKIRAIQDFKPSEALQFLFDLKTIIGEIIRSDKSGFSDAAGMAKIDGRIDRLVLLAFDLYVTCREKIYEVKALEARNTTYKLLERMNKLDERKKEQ